MAYVESVTQFDSFLVVNVTMDVDVVWLDLSLAWS